MRREQALAALAAAHRTPDTALTPRTGVARLVAHRGSGHEHNDPSAPPENTLAAVEYGFAHGADAVEVDVWRTADGMVVLHHDATTDRTTDLPGRQITDVAHTDLQRASAGRWKGTQWSAQTIPTLAQVAEVVPPGRALVVEIEEGPQVVPDVLAVLSGLPADQVMFISKNLDTAAEVKRSASDRRVLWIVDTTPRWQIGGWAQGHRRGPGSARAGFDEPADVAWLVDQVLRHDLDGLDTMVAYPPELPAAVAGAGLLWMVWTANDPRVIDQCLADGAWGITTDNTAQVREWLLNAGMTTAVGAGRAF